MTTSDILWSIGTFFACLGAVLIILESMPRRKRSHPHLLMREPHKSPGKPHPSVRTHTGKDMSRGFFYGQSTPVEPKATQPKGLSAENTSLSANGTARPHEQVNPGLRE